MTLNFLVKNFQSRPDSFVSLDVFLNNEKKYSIDRCTDNDYKFTFSISNDSKIYFILKNKNPKDTILKGDHVVKDTFLKIEKIDIDGFDIIDSINLFSNYYTAKNGVIRTNGFMTYNGTYVFKFRYPLSRHLVLCEYYTPIK